MRMVTTSSFPLRIARVQNLTGLEFFQQMPISWNWETPLLGYGHVVINSVIMSSMRGKLYFTMPVGQDRLWCIFYAAPRTWMDLSSRMVLATPLY
jgi:hypothetical protein